MKTFKIEYNSNNSGGSWWLSDKDWRKLQKNGWTIHWVKDDEYLSKFSEPKNKGRWLGALAKECEKEFKAKTQKEAMKLAVQDWEKITGYDSTDEGCNCCGAPHVFRCEKPDYIYASGESILDILGFNSSKTKRELLEEK